MERERFELSVPLRVRILSRDVLSATQPSFHNAQNNGAILRYLSFRRNKIWFTSEINIHN